MAGWVRAMVMLWTLAVVGAVAWIDVKAGHRPDPRVLMIPAGAFALLYARRRRPAEVEGADEAEDTDPDPDPDTEE